MEQQYDPFAGFFSDDKSIVNDPFAQLVSQDSEYERTLAKIKKSDVGAPNMDSWHALMLGTNVDLDPVGAAAMGLAGGAIGATAKEGATIAQQVGAKALGGAVGAASNAAIEYPLGTGLYVVNEKIGESKYIPDIVKAPIQIGLGLAAGHQIGKLQTPVERAIVNKLTGNTSVVAPKSNVHLENEADILRNNLGMDPIQRVSETPLAPDTGVLKENVDSSSSFPQVGRTITPEIVDANLVRTEIDPELSLLRQKLEETAPLAVDPVSPEIVKLREIIEARAAEAANAEARVKLASDMVDPEVRARANEELVNRDVENMFPQGRVESQSPVLDSELAIRGPIDGVESGAKIYDTEGVPHSTELDGSTVARENVLPVSPDVQTDIPIRDNRAGADEGLRDPISRFRKEDGLIDTDSFIDAIESSPKIRDYRTDTNSELMKSWDQHFAKGADNPVVRSDLNNIYTRAVADIEANAKLTDASNSGRLYSTPVHLFFKAFEKAYEKYRHTPIWDVAADSYFHKFLVPVRMVDDFIANTPGLRSLPIHERFYNPDYRGAMPEPDRFNTKLDEYRNNQHNYARYGENIGKRISAFSHEDQVKIADYMQEGFDNHKIVLTPEQEVVAKEAQDLLYHLGRESSDLGLLDPEVFKANAGKYFPRLYAKYELENGKSLFGEAARMYGDRFKARADIDELTREGMGEIKAAAYPVAKGVLQLGNDVAAARLFNEVSKNEHWATPKNKLEILPYDSTHYALWKNGELVSQGHSWKEAESIRDNMLEHERNYARDNGFVQLPKDPNLGELSGRYVHPEIANEFKYMTRVRNELWEKSLGEWRFWKSVGSVKAHLRNMVGNSMLAHLGGLPVWEQFYYIPKAVLAMKNKSPEFYAAMSQGLTNNTFSHTEFNNIKDSALKQLMSEGDSPSGLSKLYEVAFGSLDKVKGAMAHSYGAEEAAFKLAMFMHGLDNNMDAIQSAQRANKWLFDYGKRSTYLREFSNNPLGAPFAVFPAKALPRIIEAAATTPHRLLIPAAFLYGINLYANSEHGDTLESASAKRYFRKDYMKGGVGETLAKILPESARPYVEPILPNFLRLPMKDAYGGDRYLDLSYFFPWSDLTSEKEDGGILPILPTGLQPGQNPFTKILVNGLGFNKFLNKNVTSDADVAGMEGESVGDFGSEKWWEDKKRKGLYAIEQLAPTTLLDIKKVYDGPDKMDSKGRVRSSDDLKADALAFKISPVYPLEEMQRKLDLVVPDKKMAAIAKTMIGKINQNAVKMAQAKSLTASTGRTYSTEAYEQENKDILRRLANMGIQTGDLMKKWAATKAGDTQ